MNPKNDLLPMSFSVFVPQHSHSEGNSSNGNSRRWKLLKKILGGLKPSVASMDKNLPVKTDIAKHWLLYK